MNPIYISESLSIKEENDFLNHDVFCYVLLAVWSCIYWMAVPKGQSYEYSWSDLLSEGFLKQNKENRQSKSEDNQTYIKICICNFLIF